MTLMEGWIVATDARHAAFYSCTTTERGRPHVEKVHVLENDRGPKVQRHRPYMLGHGRSRGHFANSVQHYAAPGHVAEESLRRFAKAIMQWLARSMRQLGPGRVSVFAAPRLLGKLRDEVHELDRLEVGRHRVDLRDGELTSLQPSELADHPAVLAALQSPSPGRRARRQ